MICTVNVSDDEWFVLQENDLLIEELIHRSHQSGEVNSVSAGTRRGDSSGSNVTRGDNDDTVLMRRDRPLSPRVNLVVGYLQTVHALLINHYCVYMRYLLGYLICI